jgi:NADH:ubiquinone oxidoreductase subunit 6 (subunit J)
MEAGGEMALMIRRVFEFLILENLLITAVTVLGAVAIYLLLPRPRASKTIYGAALGCLAVMLAGALLIRTRAWNAETILFYAFSATAVLSGGLLVTQRNPARAALSFALVILSTCGLFLLLAAPFLMAATTIIYAGAIIVTFLFVLMLAQQEGPSDADDRSREPLLSAIAGFMLLGVLLYVLQTSYDSNGLQPLIHDADLLIADMDKALTRGQEPGATIARQLNNRGMELLEEFQDYARKKATRSEFDTLREAKELGEQPWQTDDLAGMRSALEQVRNNASELPSAMGTLRPTPRLSELSGPSAGRNLDELRRDDIGRPPLPAENTAYLGRSLFTDYLLAVELGGTLLLVATVGAIAIASRRPAQSAGRRQP